MNLAPPPYTTPDKLADHYGLSARLVREQVMALGACRKIGQKVIMLADDVETFLEAMRPCGSSNGAKSGTIQERLPVGDCDAARKRLTGKPPKGSRRKQKATHGQVISMARGRT